MALESNKFPFVRDKYLTMWVEDDIVMSIYDDVIIDLEAAKVVLKDRLELINDRAYLCFVDGTRVKYWTWEARVFQASEKNNVGIKAAALYVKSHALKTIVNFYLLINRPSVPQSCFTNREAALKWLKQCNV